MSFFSYNQQDLLGLMANYEWRKVWVYDPQMESRLLQVHLLTQNHLVIDHSRTSTTNGGPKYTVQNSLLNPVTFTETEDSRNKLLTFEIADASYPPGTVSYLASPEQLQDVLGKIMCRASEWKSQDQSDNLLLSVPIDSEEAGVCSTSTNPESTIDPAMTLIDDNHHEVADNYDINIDEDVESLGAVPSSPPRAPALSKSTRGQAKQGLPQPRKVKKKTTAVNGRAWSDEEKQNLIEVVKECVDNGLAGEPLWDKAYLMMLQRGFNRPRSGMRMRWCRDLRPLTKIDDRRRKDAKNLRTAIVPKGYKVDPTAPKKGRYKGKGMHPKRTSTVLKTTKRLAENEAATTEAMSEGETQTIDDIKDIDMSEAGTLDAEESDEDIEL